MSSSARNAPATTRIDVFTNADGEHVAVLVNGNRTESLLFTSRSMDPENRAVWLDGQRLYDVDLHWNSIYQFTVPTETGVAAPSNRLKPSA